MGPSLDASSTFALYRPEIFTTVDSSTLIDRLPVRIFLDGTRFPVSSEMGRMGMTPLDFPAIAFMSPVTIAHMSVSRVHRGPRADGKDFSKDGKDSSAEVMGAPLNPLQYGGEAGVYYGHASGKFGGDEFGSYMMGSVGNDKFQISAGASYQEWNGHTAHGHR
ncbi:MAG: hypothetical protein ABI925_09630 [Verrucomicrobiota bacterium]